MDWFIYILKEIWFFLNEVSIYLLLGFFIAGVLHVFFPDAIIRRHLGSDSIRSVTNATLFGIPIPLCSCGVVPVIVSLRNSGASRGAMVSFLISTPQVGADSFMITYSLLGWIFAVFRIGASLITALAAGILVNIIQVGKAGKAGPIFPSYTPEEGFKQRLRCIFDYIEYDLLGSIANSLVVGIILAGIISALIPDGFFERYLGSNVLSMFLMLIVGIPMYVCASASTPIAASLIMKGISPGAALVFLLVGPATNAVTITTVGKTLGRQSLAVYLISIAVFSLLLGALLNTATAYFGFKKIILLHQHEMLPEKLKLFGTFLLCGLLGWYYIKRKLRTKEIVMDERTVSLNIKGMTCMHCAGNVKKAVESVPGTSDVMVDLEGKKVLFKMEEGADMEKIKAAITAAGYTV